VTSFITSSPALRDEAWQRLLTVRATTPGAVAAAHAERKRPGRLLSERGTLSLWPLTTPLAVR
jgi:hypothetical protein